MTPEQFFCAACSSTHLQWCSNRMIRPSNVVVLGTKGDWYVMRCLRCKKGWKTKAEYVNLLLPSGGIERVGAGSSSPAARADEHGTKGREGCR